MLTSCCPHYAQRFTQSRCFYFLGEGAVEAGSLVTVVLAYPAKLAAQPEAEVVGLLGRLVAARRLEDLVHQVIHA